MNIWQTIKDLFKLGKTIAEVINYINHHHPGPGGQAVVQYSNRLIDLIARAVSAFLNVIQDVQDGNPLNFVSELLDIIQEINAISQGLSQLLNDPSLAEAVRILIGITNNLKNILAPWLSADIVAIVNGAIEVGQDIADLIETISNCDWDNLPTNLLALAQHILGTLDFFIDNKYLTFTVQSLGIAQQIMALIKNLKGKINPTQLTLDILSIAENIFAALQILFDSEYLELAKDIARTGQDVIKLGKSLKKFASDMGGLVVPDGSKLFCTGGTSFLILHSKNTVLLNGKSLAAIHDHKPFNIDPAANQCKLIQPGSCVKCKPDTPAPWIGLPGVTIQGGLVLTDLSFLKCCWGGVIFIKDVFQDVAAAGKAVDDIIKKGRKVVKDVKEIKEDIEAIAEDEDEAE